VAVGAVILEVSTLAFFGLFAAFGAFAAAIAGALGAPLAIQAAVFAGASGAGVVLVRRPLMKALGPSRRGALVSGVAGLVGQSATVVDVVADQDHPGKVHVRGEDWPAITYDMAPLEPGQVVTIVELDHTRLVVSAV
jgi:membrane protein implicated in regulation of membrane protease activity